MIYPAVPTLIVRGDFSFLIKEGWEKIRKHGRFLAILWAIFNIPINLFSYFRLEPYLSGNDSVSEGGVAFVLFLMNLLAYIPMIGIALLIREETDDYNAVIHESLKRIPLFITTTLAMLIRLMLPIMVLMVPGSLLSIPLTSAGMSENTILWILIPYFIVVVVYFTIRFYSSGMFYLMMDITNFKAVACSSALFRGNKKIVAQMIGICFILPMLLDYGALFFVESSLKYMIVSLVLSAYMYAAYGVYANMFHHMGYMETVDEVPKVND